MKKYTQIQRLVYKMLTENTGKHFLDSGGTDGRGWQRNAKKTIADFANEPTELYIKDRKDDYIERSVSVFNYLSEIYELDSICDKFNRIKSTDWDGDFYGVSSKHQAFLNEIGYDKNPREWNTYNGDSDLSQTLQGVSLRLFVDGQYEDYAIIQIHNGADVRGGYTDAKLFKVNEYANYISEYMGQSEIEDELEYITVIDEHGIEYTAEELNLITLN
jgi:hypothetical protein